MDQDKKHPLSSIEGSILTDLGKEVGWVKYDWMVLHRVLAQHQTSLLQFILSKKCTYVVIYHGALREKSRSFRKIEFLNKKSPPKKLNEKVRFSQNE